MELNEDYWDQRYRENQTGWDLGTPSPALTHYFDQIENKALSILIPGCGNAYEAEYLLNQGFKNITLIDLSSSVVSQLKDKWKTRPEIKVLHGDFFDLKGNYDLIMEQTFFCALDPVLRSKYVEKMNFLLTENGKLVGLLFDKEFEKSGPPFGGSKTEYQPLFDTYFSIEKMEPCYNSIAPRQGSELFISISKKKK